MCLPTKLKIFYFELMQMTIEIDLPVLEMSMVDRKRTARKLANWSAKETRRRLRRGRYRDGGRIPVAIDSPTGRPLIRTNQMVKQIKARLVKRREQTTYLIKPRGYRLSASEARKASASRASAKKGGGASKRRSQRVSRTAPNGKERKSHEFVWNSLQKNFRNADAFVGLTDRQIRTLGDKLHKEVRRQIDTGEFWKSRRKRLHLKLRGRAGRVVRLTSRVARRFR